MLLYSEFSNLLIFLLLHQIHGDIIEYVYDMAALAHHISGLKYSQNKLIQMNG